MPTVEMRDRCAEILVAKNVRCRTGCAVSSIGKVGLLFRLDDSIRTIVILTFSFE